MRALPPRRFRGGTKLQTNGLRRHGCATRAKHVTCVAAPERPPPAPNAAQAPQRADEGATARTVEAEETRATVPTSIWEVDNGRILGFGADLSEDHPGFHDPAYKARRHWISQLAKSHVIGTPIPDVEYTAEERNTWRMVLQELEQLVPRYACREFVEAYDAFQFRPDVVPQLQQLHERLHAATGWSVRPVAGLMHPRDFLNGLAFKYFHSTQYVRHHSNPMYTPEPDICHEVLGHMPMLLNKDFCALVEAIGKASLGATEKQIWHLTKVYWYTVEFGVVRQDGDIKAFGAGILSSYGELEWMGSGSAIIEPLNPWAPQPKMSYKDGFQKKYFSLDSFEQGAAMLKDYSAQMQSQR